MIYSTCDLFPTEARFGNINLLHAIDTFNKILTFSNTIQDH